MATVYLTPIGFTDLNNNISSGTDADIDEGIIGGTPNDSDVVTTVTNEWSPNFGTGSEFRFALSNAPADYGSFVSARLRVRGTIQNNAGDTNDMRCQVVGTQAPTFGLSFNQADSNNTFTTKAGSLSQYPLIDPSAADVNTWAVRVYQLDWSRDMSVDNSYFDISAIEVELNYNTSGTTLDATDVESDSEVTSPAIGQEHGLNATDVQSTSNVTTPALTREVALTATSVQSTSEVSAPSVELPVVLTSVSVQATSEVTTPAIAQEHALTNVAAQSTSEVSAPAIAQEHALTTVSSESASSVSSPAIAEINALLATSVNVTEISAAPDANRPGRATTCNHHPSPRHRAPPRSATRHSPRRGRTTSWPRTCNRAPRCPVRRSGKSTPSRSPVSSRPRRSRHRRSAWASG